MFGNEITVVFLLCGLICSSCAQEARCSTPDGGIGLCKHFSECPQLMDLVSAKRQSAATISFVKNRICGDLNKLTICCNDCYTPDGKAGLCTPLQNCPHIFEMLQTGNRTGYAFNSILDEKSVKYSTDTIDTTDTNTIEWQYRSNNNLLRCRNGQMEVCCGPPPEPVLKGNCQKQLTAFPPDAETHCCGIDSNIDSKISGGNSTRIDQYPWLVILEYEEANLINLKCGGTLISNRYVLTAAHCVIGKRARGLKSVRLGEYDTSINGQDCVFDDCTDGPISIGIEESIPHPEYNSTTVWNDIALIRLAQKVDFTDFIRPICLPWSDVTQEQELSQLTAWAAGWGQVNRTVQSSNIKLHVGLPLVDTRACQRSYSQRSGLKSPLWSKQLCAGGERGKDSCKGDSGGPLMLERIPPSGGRPAHELIGIISFGPTACGTEYLPGIYTKVYEYNHWIRSHIRPEM